MKKYIYVQPSVKVTELEMIQTLCASGGGGSTPELGIPLSTFTPNATTDIQL